MTEETAIDQLPATYKPWLTIICSLVSIVLFIGINLERPFDNWEIYAKWGAPSPMEIFNGSYWGLITSNFLHTEIWHIAFNLYWLVFFGKKIEFESNKLFYGCLIVTSAYISSVAQLAFSDSTGIGLSGIGYALFGFIYIKSKTDEAYKNYLDKRTINLFMAWLVLCIVLTQTNIWTVGNAAHIGGLLWGMTVGFIPRFNKGIQWTIGIAFILISTSMISWSPFSTSYLSYQAYELHKAQKINMAIDLYKRILKRDADNEFAIENLKQLEIYKLSEKALKLHQEYKFDEARIVYNNILKIDTNNAWAKENLKLLPVSFIQSNN